MELEPDFTDDERKDLRKSIDILLAWLGTHRHGNPYFDAIQQSLSRKALRETWGQSERPDGIGPHLKR